MKKFILPIIILLISSCSNPTDQEKIIGNWKLVSETQTKNAETTVKEIKTNTTIEFSSDGKCVMYDNKKEEGIWLITTLDTTLRMTWDKSGEVEWTKYAFEDSETLILTMNSTSRTRSTKLIKL